MESVAEASAQSGSNSISAAASQNEALSGQEMRAFLLWPHDIIVHERMKPMDAVSSLFSGKVNDPPRTGWLWRHWRDGGLRRIINEHGEHALRRYKLAASAVTWSDLPWIKEAWGDQPLGRSEDALRAEELGATGVIFSSRRAFRAIPSQIVAEAMPKLRAANSKLDCAMDGGERVEGADPLCSFGAGGHLGLTRAFELIKEERWNCVQNISEIQEQGEKLRRRGFAQPQRVCPCALAMRSCTVT